MKYYLILGEKSHGRKRMMKIRTDYYERPDNCLLKPIPINENDIKQAECFSQFVNGIIEDLKRAKE